MSMRFACVQPAVNKRMPEQAKVDTAIRYIDQATEAGVRLIAFPEGFPGPYIEEANWSATDVLSKKAKENNINIIFGEVERDPHEKDVKTYNLVAKLVDCNGNLVGSYARMQPAPDEVNFPLMDGKIISPGNEFFLHEVEGVKVGLLICSEIFAPELPRTLGLLGVDLIFAHVGGMLYELRDTWRCITWARAIENLCYTSTCLNLYGKEDGLAIIAGPEKIIAETSEEGMLVADLDIDRLHWLRAQNESLELPKPYRVVPGLLRYRRPELYTKLVDPDVEKLDFHKYRK
ncbi:MAG TPA: carbon-nitrogen hydrolase family protein [Anaerolineaceae bacterium]|nr:carbon-nitrogen hydrolase family protein [Anaerolineaceae bacterium]